MYLSISKKRMPLCARTLTRNIMTVHMETFAALLAFYITGWIRLTKPSNAEILIFGTTEQTIEQRVGCRWFYTPWRSCEATVMETPVLSRFINGAFHYNDVIMSTMASLINSLTIVCSTVCSGADQKTSKLRVTGLCAGNSLVTGEFPTQKVSDAENVSIWWRHHAKNHVRDSHFAVLCCCLAAVYFTHILHG